MAYRDPHHAPKWATCEVKEAANCGGLWSAGQQFKSETQQWDLKLWCWRSRWRIR